MCFAVSAKEVKFPLLAVLVALLFCICGCNAGSDSRSAAPVARHGVLDLASWDFEKDGSVDLSGEWEFYWHRLFAPDDFSGAHAPVGSAYLALPAAWNGVRLNGEKLGGNGFATFRLRILPGAAHSAIALHLETVHSAYRLWSNGKLLVESGVVGKEASAEIPDQSIRQPRLPIGNQPVELVLQISNHHYREGGVVSAIRLGPLDKLEAAQHRQWGFTLFCVGSLMVMGIYHIALFIFRRKDIAPLYFGTYCLLWMGYFLTSKTNGGVIRLFYENFPVFFLNRIDLICFVISVPVVYCFFRTLYPREFSLRLQLITWVLAAAFTALGLAVPTMAFTSVIPVYYVCSIMLILYSLAMLFKAMKGGREGAAFILLGFAAVGLAGTNDMLSDLQVIHSVNLFRAGMLLFILFQAVALSLRFSKAFTTVEHLSAEREEHILALSRMDRLKDEFLANTSHELRTPLNGIIGLAESLGAGAGGPVSEEARADLKMISLSGRRLNNLVNDILDLSRLKSSDIQLHRKAVDVHSLADTVLAVTEPLTRGRRLSLINAIPADIPPVDGDEDRLQQILFNLVGNAVKFTDRGEVTVSAFSGDCEVEVLVRDTGIGIPTDELETIFTAFEQVDSSAARNHGGVGLGLGISRRLVELHGGRLWAESTPGSGAIFRFTLPISTQAAPPVAVRVKADALLSIRDLRTPNLDPRNPSLDLRTASFEPRTTNSASRPPRILAVDDDPVNLKVVRNHLGLEGMAVTAAASGREALAMIEGGEVFDLLLLDVMMPGMTGFEVCRGVRRRYHAAELPVIMLTAKNRLCDLTEGLECGANDYLGKPFAREELLARVRAQLKVGKAHEISLENSRLRREVELRTQTELELRLNQRRLNGMLHTVPEPIVAINESREIAYCNRVFEERSGYSFDDLLGQSVNRLFGPTAGPLETWLTALEECGAELPASGAPLKLIAADGSTWSGRVVPAALELENERLLVLLLGETHAVATSLRWIDDLSQNRQRLQQLEETINGLTPLVLERHPGFIDDLRAVDRSLERMSRELTPELPEQDQRKLIVEVMKLALDLWGDATQTTKADLARQSSQWAVYVNQDGWERTQTLDRYLDIQTLPARPRLKKVLLTGDFVLSNAPGDTPLRRRFETAMDRLRDLN